MMEFVLSRVWMVIAGLAVMAVLLAAFTGLNQGMEERSDIEGAYSLAGIIDRLEEEEGSVVMEVDLDRTIADTETYFVLCPGSIWVHSGGSAHAVTSSGKIVLFDNGVMVDSLRLEKGDRIVIRSSSGEVQVEKVSTM
jgi:succinylglutamate desuccinylase